MPQKDQVKSAPFELDSSSVGCDSESEQLNVQRCDWGTSRATDLSHGVNTTGTQVKNRFLVA